MLKVGIIGFGVMGTNHYRVFQNITQVQVVCFFDPEPKEAGGLRGYSNLDDMLGQEELDVVIVAAPTQFHKEIALKCIDKKIHMLIEKPVAFNYQEGAEIQDALEANPVKVAVGYVERFNPVIQSLKKELVDKDVYAVSISRVGPIPPRICDVGVLTDLTVHDIDIVRFITQKEIVDYTIYKSKKIHSHYEDNAILSATLDNEAVVNIFTNWLTPFKKRVVEVATKQGYYEADLITQDLKVYADYNPKNGAHSVRPCWVKKGEPLLHELRTFINYIETGEMGHLASVYDSMQTLKIIESAISENRK